MSDNQDLEKPAKNGVMIDIDHNGVASKEYD
jgi:hypothetical protein